METNLENLKTVAATFSEEIAGAELDTPAKSEEFRIRFLGQRRGVIPKLFKTIPDLPKQDRRSAGQLLNALRKEAQTALESAIEQHRVKVSNASDIDLTLPGRRSQWAGSRHPITLALAKITDIFKHMGFAIAEGT